MRRAALAGLLASVCGLGGYLGAGELQRLAREQGEAAGYLAGLEDGLAAGLQAGARERVLRVTCEESCHQGSCPEASR